MPAFVVVVLFPLFSNILSKKWIMDRKRSIRAPHLLFPGSTRSGPSKTNELPYSVISSHLSKIGLGGDLVQRLSCIFWRNRSPAPLARPTLKLGTCRTACDSSISRRWCSCSHVVWVTLGSVSLMESGAPDGYGPPYCQYAYG